MAQQKTYFSLLSIHQILMLTSLCFVHRFVSVGNVSFPLSALIFPLTFLTTDIAASISHKQAKNMMWFGILAQLPFAVLCVLAELLPSPATNGGADAYTYVFAGVLRTACASIIGCAIGQSLNIYIFSTLQRSAPKLRFAWRYLIASTVGQSAFTITALPLIFWGEINAQQLTQIISGSMIAKVAYSMCLAVLSSYWLRCYLRRQHFIAISKYEYFNNVPLTLRNN